MTFEYDNKGKFFTDIISKTPVDVLVQTTTGLVQGILHIHRDERLKDELDRGKNFLALTEASVINADGEILYENDFIAIHRGQIVWVMPREGEEETESLL